MDETTTRAGADEPVVVDAIGMACPLPVIELAAAVDEVATGTVLELRADDPAAKVDVPVWCRMQRHRLDDVAKLDDHLRFRVTKLR